MQARAALAQLRSRSVLCSPDVPAGFSFWRVNAGLELNAANHKFHNIDYANNVSEGRGISRAFSLLRYVEFVVGAGDPALARPQFPTPRGRSRKNVLVLPEKFRRFQ